MAACSVALLAAIGLGGDEEGALHPPVRLEANGEVIDTGPVWGHSGPWFGDVDGDGRRDLLVGDFGGKFRFFRNVGEDTDPRLEGGGFLQAGGVDASVNIY